MKVTLLNLYSPEGQSSINKLAESKTSDLTTMRISLRLMKAAKEHDDELQAVVSKLNEIYKPKLEELGDNDVFLRNEINAKLVEELGKAEAEIDIEQLTLEQLHTAGLTAKDIMQIEWLLLGD